MINTDSKKKLNNLRVANRHSSILAPFPHHATITTRPRRSGHPSHQAVPPSASRSFTAGAGHRSSSSAVWRDADVSTRESSDSRENGEIYPELLNLVNLFAQGFNGRARLVCECRSFLEGGLERRTDGPVFKEMLGWDEAMERSALAKEHEEALLVSREAVDYSRPPEEVAVECGSILL